MKNKLIILIIIFVIIGAGFLLLSRTGEKTPLSYTIGESTQIAEAWIKNNSPTYNYDGFDLQLEEVKELEKESNYEIIFSFNSRSAGYGDDREIAAQVITPHMIFIIIDAGNVTSAITDETYDEMRNEYMNDISYENLTISLYFLEMVEEEEKIIEVKREIPYTISIGRASVEELLKGPSFEEKEAGILTAIPEGVKLLDIDIQFGVASVDFNEKLQEGVAGSAMVIAIRNQIEETLMQFETVEEVMISINGETEDILQP